MNSYPYPIFSAFGVEAEYMIVNSSDCRVAPVADRLLGSAAPGAELEGEVERDGVGWSNELTLHVVELKTDGPVSNLEATAALFQREVRVLNGLAGPLGARLLPGAMHPSMDPDKEMRLWPNENDIIYKTFDRIFDCRGHGWSNLQSVHINFPFQTDEDFARLHAALRVVLPLIPALCASSPFVSGARARELCHRVAVYRTNAAKIPEVSGKVIPERVFTIDEYKSVLLPTIYRALAPHDPEGVLQEEWVNARGAIARFDRGAIELRLMDIQEHPTQDLARVALVTKLVEALANERYSSLSRLKKPSEDELLPLLERTTQFASNARLEDPDYLALFGQKTPLTARELWARLGGELLDPADFASRTLAGYFATGTLAEKLDARFGHPGFGDALDAGLLRATLRDLSDCLESGSDFA